MKSAARLFALHALYPRFTHLSPALFSFCSGTEVLHCLSCRVCFGVPCSLPEEQADGSVLSCLQELITSKRQLRKQGGMASKSKQKEGNLLCTTLHFNCCFWNVDDSKQFVACSSFIFEKGCGRRPGRGIVSVWNSALKPRFEERILTPCTGSLCTFLGSVSIIRIMGHTAVPFWWPPSQLGQSLLRTEQK